MTREFIGCDPQAFFDSLPAEQKNTYTVEYAVGRPEHRDDPARALRILTIRGNTVYVGCFKTGMPRDGGHT